VEKIYRIKSFFYATAEGFEEKKLSNTCPLFAITNENFDVTMLIKQLVSSCDKTKKRNQKLKKKNKIKRNKTTTATTTTVSIKAATSIESAYTQGYGRPRQQRQQQQQQFWYHRDRANSADRPPTQEEDATTLCVS